LYFATALLSDSAYCCCAPQLNANLKLGRRARRALMRRMADEKANTEQL
jgi:hypothetical protein